MLFTAYLMPDDVLVRRPDYRSAVAAVVRANNGTMGKGGIVQLPDGGIVQIDENDFSLKAVSPIICRVIFDTAVRTNTYVTNYGSDGAPLMVQGTKLKIDRDLGPTTLVANPNVLCAKLQERLTRWQKDNARMVADGIMGPDGQFLIPPPSPTAERRVLDDTSGIAAKCEKTEQKMASRLGWKIVRHLVTMNATWGVVWRADVAPHPDPSTWFRETCWQSPHDHVRKGISVSTQPLEMFDKTKSVKPLPSN